MSATVRQHHRKREKVESHRKKEKKNNCDLSVIQCFLCGEIGHFQSKCPKAKSKKGSDKQSSKGVDTVLMTVEGEKWPH